MLVPALVSCMILSRFRDLCKSVDSSKVGIETIMFTAWNCCGMKCSRTCKVPSTEPGTYSGLNLH